MFLQLSQPPSLPPIFEMARPELKLAGLRIDPELFSRSKMGYSIDMAIVSASQVSQKRVPDKAGECLGSFCPYFPQVVPAPPEKTRPITGYPTGSWLNYVAWSRDSRHISFTVSGPG